MSAHPEFDAFKKRTFKKSPSVRFWYYWAGFNGWLKTLARRRPAVTLSMAFLVYVGIIYAVVLVGMAVFD